MASVSKHTLRFWEKTLNGVIVPLRTKGGQRRYTKYHLQIINEIKKQLKDRKLIKVKFIKPVLGERTKKEFAKELASLTNSTMVHQVGFVIVLYKK